MPDRLLGRGELLVFGGLFIIFRLNQIHLSQFTFLPEELIHVYHLPFLIGVCAVLVLCLEEE